MRLQAGASAEAGRVGSLPELAAGSLPGRGSGVHRRAGQGAQSSAIPWLHAVGIPDWGLPLHGHVVLQADGLALPTCSSSGPSKICRRRHPKSVTDPFESKYKSDVCRSLDPSFLCSILQHMAEQLLKLEGRVLAVVGHVHMDGIERRWREVLLAGGGV